jgi:hypothetical protein
VTLQAPAVPVSHVMSGLLPPDPGSFALPATK